MKKGFVIIVTALFINTLLSQTATITNSLNNKLIAASNKDYIKVNVVFTNQVDHISLNQELKDKKVSLDVRAKTVIRKSTQLAESTQKNVISYLTNNSSKVKWFKPYWIINMISLEARKDIILQLAFLPEIDYIELYDHFTGKPIEVIKGDKTNEKAIGAAEPGLLAINAHKLWALGYTGKARKLFSIDTGVIKDHPSISDAWLGNYLPLTQAWHGIDSPTPVDKDGNHGTHTIGTVLGLDSSTQDTIGVAPGAYFMAADPIVTNVNDIKPLPAYIDVFEFALNPDGDTNTTHDIPDVINNSWGIDEHEDTSICFGYVTQMFNAIEAAGIANVFSAGNEGPTDTTIGQPQYVSTGLVNTFTVGAVNAHSAGNPIAGFSSRGPTACPANGSIAIKPEVVAPGVNVRSSVGLNNYVNYQGTSMAGPHASGAVLLLKEAFPNATGEEILLALYNTAIDLGLAGEDNTYGKGMIDVKAAYDSLALHYTPINPNQDRYGVKIYEITKPNQPLTCNQTINPTFIIKNDGDSLITTATIYFRLNNEPEQNIIWNGNLNPNDTISISLPSLTAQSYGNYDFAIRVELDTTKIEYDYTDNQMVYHFNIAELYSTLPYNEDFELVNLYDSEWTVINSDYETTWDTLGTKGLPNGYHSATMQLIDYNGSGQTDDLISPRLRLPNQDSIFLRFDIAYQMIHPIVADSMRIYISSDCGSTYNLIYNKGGDSLQTLDTVTFPFVPYMPHHWRTDYIDITSYAGNDVLVKFQTFNKSGNNLYLDNIWVYEGAEPVGIEENEINNISIYPNPTNNTLTIEFTDEFKDNTTIELLDLIGKQVLKRNVSGKSTTINISNLNSGVYIVRLTNNSSSISKKIIKQ